jgi:hypothetical protein
MEKQLLLKVENKMHNFQLATDNEDMKFVMQVLREYIFDLIETQETKETNELKHN